MLVMPVEVRTQVWYNPDLKSSHFMIPALIGVIMLFLSVVLTSTAIVRERERGTIEQLIVTPVRSWELLVGKLTPYVLLAFLNTVEILVIGVLLFGVPVAGSVALLLVVLRHLPGHTARDRAADLDGGQVAAGGDHPVAVLPAAEHLPVRLHVPDRRHAGVAPGAHQPVPAELLPEIVRGIILRGAGVADLYPQILALVVYGVAVMTLAASRFRKRLD